jgi:hypothetical protein
MLQVFYLDVSCVSHTFQVHVLNVSSVLRCMLHSKKNHVASVLCYWAGGELKAGRQGVWRVGGCSCGALGCARPQSSIPAPECCPRGERGGG